MPLREFVDGTGVSWRVWHTAPERTEGLTGEYQRGWLTFDSGIERRRLVPVPPDWFTLPDDRLRLLLGIAESPRPAGADRKKTDRRKRDRREGERRMGDRRRPDARQ